MEFVEIEKMTDQVKTLYKFSIDTKEQKNKYQMGVVNPVVYSVTYLY